MSKTADGGVSTMKPEDVSYLTAKYYNYRRMDAMAETNEKEKTVGFKPSEFQEGGGLLSDVDVTWKECRFELWDYNGRTPTPVPALRIKMQVVGGEEHIQYYSAGNSKDFVPNRTGRGLVAVGSAKGINTNSNAAILITSAVNAGFPEDKIGEDIGVLDGMECHMARVPAPRRAGLVKQPRADGRVFEDTILVVESIAKMPWEKKAAGASKPGGKPAPTPSKAKEPEAAGDDEDAITMRATQVVIEILGDNPDGIAKKDLGKAVFQKLLKDPMRNDVMKKVYDDGFLTDGPWGYEGGMVKM